MPLSLGLCRPPLGGTVEAPWLWVLLERRPAAASWNDYGGIFDATGAEVESPSERLELRRIEKETERVGSAAP